MDKAWKDFDRVLAKTLQELLEHDKTRLEAIMTITEAAEELIEAKEAEND